jgi:mono/diheme cytochrome c family protein
MKPLFALGLFLALALPAARADAQEAAAPAAAPTGSQPPHPFTEEYLADPANIDVGRTIWQEQCAHCHGAKAYPGKAPKLKPTSYKPEFVYRRVTDGFRAMPPWVDVYTDEERMQVVTYILSRDFNP